MPAELCFKMAFTEILDFRGGSKLDTVKVMTAKVKAAVGCYFLSSDFNLADTLGWISVSLRVAENLHFFNFLSVPDGKPRLFRIQNFILSTQRSSRN